MFNERMVRRLPCTDGKKPKKCIQVKTTTCWCCRSQCKTLKAFNINNVHLTMPYLLLVRASAVVESLFRKSLLIAGLAIVSSKAGRRRKKFQTGIHTYYCEKHARVDPIQKNEPFHLMVCWILLAYLGNVSAL